MDTTNRPSQPSYPSPASNRVVGWLLSGRHGILSGLQRVQDVIATRSTHHIRWPRSNAGERASSVSSCESDDEDDNFWVNSLGPMLDSMLAEGQYSAVRRRELADFFTGCIAPYFGPKPTRDASNGRLIPAWKSFMTDDFTPLEPSWTWKTGNAHPVLKFSAEAVPQSNTATGALASAMQMADGLSRYTDSPLEFDRDALVTVVNLLTSRVDSIQQGREHEQGSTALSQVMIGFDVNHGKTAVKAYILPTLRSLETGQSKLEVVTAAVRACGAGACWEHVLQYLAPQPDADPFILAIDCTSLDKARFKPRWSHSAAAKFVAAIRDLWARLAGNSDGDNIWRVASQTAGGTPMYFSVDRAATLPTPKFYVPVRLLGWDDGRIAQVVGEWLAAHGNPAAGSSYVTALQSLSPGRSLSSRYGFHTYIGISPLPNGEIEPSVYLNPSIFS
ncbi:aromatic prenyltransferase [Auriculariales sp. MPI-PUGE-AT-0066]|nr:aromatic prenyltransferase [Auriculariales sp. MPI-PUGE-AT-0066]